FVLLLVLIIQTHCALFGQYYSQEGQDKLLNETFFHDKKDGTFVEFGAYDGVNLSNTYFYEKELGWKGICVEPMPEPFEKLQKNRSCFCVQGCVSPKAGTVDFLKIVQTDEKQTSYTSMLSGIVSAYDPRHLARIKHELKLWAKKHQNMKYEIIQVPCYTLGDLLDKYNMKHIDYLSIDTEGGEYEILKSINFKKYTIDFITVEDNYKSSKLQKFLKKKGYQLVAKLTYDLVFKREISGEK